MKTTLFNNIYDSVLSEVNFSWHKMNAFQVNYFGLAGPMEIPRE